jgi:hypothetical protein
MEKVMVRGEQLRQTCICIVLMNKYTNATAGVSKHPARNIVDGMDMDMGSCGCGCGCRTTCKARAAALLQERVVHKVERALEPVHDRQVCKPAGGEGGEGGRHTWEICRREEEEEKEEEEEEEEEEGEGGREGG